MTQALELLLTPKAAHEEPAILLAAAHQLRVPPEAIHTVIVRRRSIDARHGNPRFRLAVEVHFEPPPLQDGEHFTFRPPVGPHRAIVVGSGPAGLFAALRLLELGIRPVLLERGKDVRARSADLQALIRDGTLDPDSNYCFGEGGAGTYSDGKLYTRATKRGDVRRVLSLLCHHGASAAIQVDSHAHIGSDRLPGVIRRIRQTLIDNEAEVHFGTRVTGLLVENGKLRGVVTEEDQAHYAEAVVLATGHSARDVYQLLERQGLALEAKGFAMGVRIEHPQELIDRAQYRVAKRGDYLPAASYTLSAQVDGRGVYSFCMCPGGTILPASTGGNELVLNGASESRRDSPFANSGFVVSVQPEDWSAYADQGPVGAGIAFQAAIEAAALLAGGGQQRAPAQRATDFVRGRVSRDLAEHSYRRGAVTAPLHEVLPPEMVARLREALRVFDRKLPGYLSDQAQLFAVESRTSSPLRVPRDRETRMHVELTGLFPCGEGAGYAGGIMSSALDGERTAEAVASYLGA